MRAQGRGVCPYRLRVKPVYIPFSFARHASGVPRAVPEDPTVAQNLPYAPLRSVRGIFRTTVCCLHASACRQLRNRGRDDSLPRHLFGAGKDLFRGPPLAMLPFAQYVKRDGTNFKPKRHGTPGSTLLVAMRLSRP